MAVLTCTRCASSKPADEFGVCRSRKTGRQAWCKECKSEHYQTNKDRHLEKCREWREANLERKRAADRRWYEQNKERHNETMRRWYEKRPEYRQEYNRRYRLENAERLRTRKKVRYAEDRVNVLARRREQYQQDTERRQRLRASQRVYREANPDVFKAIRRRYEARKRGAVGRHSRRAWEQVIVRHHGCCAYCGTKPDVLHADHVIPLSRGGTDYEGNILPACGRCNHSKLNKLLSEWRRDGGAPALTWKGVVENVSAVA